MMHVSPGPCDSPAVVRRRLISLRRVGVRLRATLSRSLLRIESRNELARPLAPRADHLVGGPTEPRREPAGAAAGRADRRPGLLLALRAHGSAFDRNEYAVANRSDRADQVGMAEQPLVEGAKRRRALGLVCLVGDRSAPQHVVDDEHGAGLQQRHDELEVVAVFLLEAVEKREVKARLEFCQTLAGILKAKIGAVQHPGPLQIAARRLMAFGVDLERDDL